MNSPAVDSLSSVLPKRVFITGASGCVGHYLVETLLEETPHELFLLLRTPDKLASALREHGRVHVLEGSLSDLSPFKDLLPTMDAAVLAAAAWGGNQNVMDINANRNLELMSLLDPQRCQQVVYFSTASILDRQNEPLEEAGKIGTDYIRSKYECHRRLPELAIYPKITTVFPTLVFGGDKDKPYSFISAGLSEVTQRMRLIRFLKADASFHFIHAQDIARVVTYLLDHPSTEGYREFVLGNPPMTAEQTVKAACEYLGIRILFQVSMSFWLADVIIRVFRIEMAPWDYFCVKYRHFVYSGAVNPASFGLSTYCPTLADLLQIHGIAPG